MAPKQPENVPMVTSSEDDEEESGSVQNKSDSSSGEESDSSSDEESQPVVSPKKDEKTPVKTSVVSKPSSSKTTTKPTHVVSSLVKTDEKPKQNLFARIFSEEDEVVLLKGIIDFTGKNGNPTENMDVFYEYVKKSISFNVTKDQLVTKVRNLKRKFDEKILKSLDKGITEEDQIVFSKAFDKRCFDLSRKIWGIDGVLPSKSKKVRQEELGKRVKDEEDEKPERHVISSSSLSFGQEYVSFFKAENPTCVFDEAEWIAILDDLKDGPEKRKWEAKLKKTKALKEGIVMAKLDFATFVTKAIFKQD
ncbi:hypothetical protein CARUB_v10025071mg [Capsella rubella]|uniref:Glabrous enhancer-binding protein-like DBD domain-containing protein n=1 Tax=Capsella rubella TaxID=81985 RepID=R0G095_9BRAS|nr:probable transcription factor At4g01260 [Capsella rubella]EOA28832.1 hypothetical protein CARUB_v10025071mg [Capsella rubella]